MMKFQMIRRDVVGSCALVPKLQVWEPYALPETLFHPGRHLFLAERATQTQGKSGKRSFKRRSVPKLEFGNEKPGIVSQHLQSAIRRFDKLKALSESKGNPKSATI